MTASLNDWIIKGSKRRILSVQARYFEKLMKRWNKMKVKDLIKKLEEFNQDLEVVIDNDNIGYFDLLDVQLSKSEEYENFVNLRIK